VYHTKAAHQEDGPGKSRARDACGVQVGAEAERERLGSLLERRRILTGERIDAPPAPDAHAPQSTPPRRAAAIASSESRPALLQAVAA
jgi:hypothetical protein